MLARRRTLRVDGREIERTPLLVPSFSSKGFPDVRKIIEYSAELIDGPTLVSAYDIHYERRMPALDFPSLIFLDSGGYEASAERDASDLADRDHVPKTWTPKMHDAVLNAWQPAVPSVIVSYDHPDRRAPIREQIDRALALPLRNSSMLREILLKPESKGQTLLRIPALLEPISKSFKQYQQGCELHKAQEVIRIVLPARHNTALPLEPGKKTLDLPPPRIAT